VKHTKLARRERGQQGPLTPFLAAVRAVVLAIPRAQTRSYGLVAELAGRPGGARAVARALHSLDQIPWWRVCRAGGSFAPQVAQAQERLLRKEGWRPKPMARKRRRDTLRGWRESG
jgi:methylated-DNA-protein-cysteine methyltransferase related protein